jgi:thiol-disulfide isomerase/thioredoxin
LEVTVEMNDSLKLLIALVIIVAAIVLLSQPNRQPAGPTIAANSNLTLSLNSSENGGQNLSQIIAQEAAQYPAAPEITDPTGFINVPDNFTLASEVEKNVVLLDFWTYSCINCQREIPYLEAWYKQYSNQGLVIVGIHTPEFDFEKNYSNVQAAVQRLGITYPVVLDSNYGTWGAYQNSYWPHLYLINIDGFIVYDHIGEGDYNTTEAEIRQYLAQRDQRLGINANMTGDATVNPISIDFNQVQSPETYFGSNRNQYLTNGQQGIAGVQNLTLPTSASTLSPNSLYLGGSWNFSPEYASTTGGQAEIEYYYSAKNVYMVASSPDSQGVTLNVSVDGQPLNSTNAGGDVTVSGNQSTVNVGTSRLYWLVGGQNYGQHVLQIVDPSGDLQAYTFTFG